MSEKLTPEEVARLDPFGVRKIPASEELKELLKHQPEKIGVEAEKLITFEKDEWRKVLDINVDIPYLPTEITPEIKHKLESEGFALVYIPNLDLLPDQLKKQNPKSYLKELAKQYPNWKPSDQYPNWKPSEDLSTQKKNDYRVSRNLEEWYWKNVKDGNIDFPALSDRWMAVETMEKPRLGDKYQKTLFGERLGFEDRFSVSWDDAKEAIDKVKPMFLTDIGLIKGDVRFLEVLPWNLLANRFGWGKSNTWEWTNTEYREGSESYHLFVGYSGYGGAANVGWERSGGSRVGVGFRLAVVFGT